MTPMELVLAVQTAGGRVERMHDGKARVVGGQVSPDIIHGIKSNREAFLEAWEEESKSRFDRAPSIELALRDEPPGWRPEVYARVERYVRKQAAEVCRWVVLRGTSYQDAKGWPSEACVASALADVLHWQMGRCKSPEWQLEVFEEVARHE